MAAPNLSSVDITLGLYNYDPSSITAICGTVTFMIVAAVHVWQCRQHWPRQLWALSVGLSVECVGHLARVVSVHHPTHARPYFASYIALLLAPFVLAVECYVIFGQIIQLTAPAESRQKGYLSCILRSIAPASLSISLLASLFAIIGASIIATVYRTQSLWETLPQAGVSLLKIGFILQLIGMTTFSSFALCFMLKDCHPKSSPSPSVAQTVMGRRKLGWAIIAATALLAVLATYRVVDLYNSIGSSVGYIAQYEWPFWVFDALPVLGACILLVLLHLEQISISRTLSLHARTKNGGYLETNADFHLSYSL